MALARLKSMRDRSRHTHTQVVSDLPPYRLAEGAGRLAGVLGQCSSLACLDVGYNGIGADGAGRLAGVLGKCSSITKPRSATTSGWKGQGGRCVRAMAGVLRKCSSLALLDLNDYSIAAEGAARLAGVLGQCSSLAHLDLSDNSIWAERAARLAGGLGKCSSLAYVDIATTGPRVWGRLAGWGAGAMLIAY